MHIRHLTVAAVFAALALASCDKPAEPGPSATGGTEAPATPAPGFAHAMTSDMSGYYMPVGDVAVGKWRLNHLFVGQSTDFQSWEGGSRSATFAPVMLQFDDATSPMVETELGETRSVTARVLPTSYAVSDTAVAFSGQSAELGRVTFEGRLDPGALATAKRNLGGDGVVMTGRLRVGDQTVEGVRMTWWMGD
ncbi:hypothetical protein GGQ87_002799 [Brevundimonas alba]|uniref:Lipid/polyisoprenoid-binding YceI-like domain-containing protein n=1 Tax=Brevundimonas alba TaxID=74314 RepID=A0A7X5YPK3_9CAUL|nr:hypothetical protein [Brevundimonas alba]NJC42504.1 hypothetical protein [Brevundimonas alba]